MNLGRRAKILVGLGTAWIFAYPLLFVGFAFAMTFGATAGAPQESGVFPGLFFGVFFPLHCLSILVSVGLIAFYLVHIIKNQEASENARIVAALGMVFLPLVAMPLYYYFFIWKEEPPAWGRAEAVGKAGDAPVVRA